MDSLERGQVWWADLPPPRGSEPGYSRPVLAIQADNFNRSVISTAIFAIITSNMRLANAPGNVLLPSELSGLPKESVVNLSQLLTLDQKYLVEHVSNIPKRLLDKVDQGLRLVLAL